MTDRAAGMTFSVFVPAGASLGGVVEAFIRGAFATVAELYGDTDDDRNPTLRLLADESRLLAAWREIRGV